MTVDILEFANALRQGLGFKKVFRRVASYGHTAFGRFYGMKCHLLVDSKGNLVRWCLTTGSVHDLTPVKEGFLDGLTGKVIADSGYVSRPVRYALMDKNLEFIACPLNSQNELVRIFANLTDAVPYMTGLINHPGAARLSSKPVDVINWLIDPTIQEPPSKKQPMPR